MSDNAEARARIEVARVSARWMQIIGVPLILGGLAWIGLTVVDAHDSVTRIEQELVDQFRNIDSKLDDHEARLRGLERGPRP